MKTLIFAVFALSSFEIAWSAEKWNCKTIEGTLKIIKTSGCVDTRICVGYANCEDENKKSTVVKMVCKAGQSFNCPEANECLDQLADGKITIATNKEKSSRGLYRFCPSMTQLGKPKDIDVDVSNSKFCDVLNNNYERHGEAGDRSWTIDRMTDRPR